MRIRYDEYTYRTLVPRTANTNVMTDIAISVESLSKSYLVGHQVEQAERYTTLRDVLARSTRNLARKTRDMFTGRAIVQGDEVEEFWALKDVSFEIRRGDRVGIIGRNGAGKSTLLKVLSRITEPTQGRIKIAGRVASLLEVGTGFHPELTGRENIFLNGAILGMKRTEILQTFDEIVSFSEVERFLDTPVKRYSSGMYVRLAFAVAAHLQPEILIVDEVLAVGDAGFQKKCLGKMREAGKEGKTILFVSHNMGMIRQLCDYGIWLDAGSIRSVGNVSEVVQGYFDSGSQKEKVPAVALGEHPNRLVRMRKILQSASLANQDDVKTSDFTQLETVKLTIEYASDGVFKIAGLGFAIYTIDGVRVGGGNSFMVSMPPYSVPENGRVVFRIPARQFTPGSYTINLSTGSHPSHIADKIDGCIFFDILQADVYGTGYLLTKEDGVSCLDFRCDVVSADGN